MVGFDPSDIAVSSVLGRAVGRVLALRAVDWNEIPYLKIVAGIRYLAWEADVPGRHGDSDGE